MIHSRAWVRKHEHSGVGSLTLTYGYNLANQLTSIIDPFGAEVGYGYNSDGKLKEVNSSGFARFLAMHQRSDTALGVPSKA